MRLNTRNDGGEEFVAGENGDANIDAAGIAEEGDTGR